MANSDVLASLCAGGIAGLTADTLFYPFDTIKTRLQSSFGFWKAGGFRNVYKGIGSIGLASFPHSAVFFLFYDVTKNACRDKIPNVSFTHMVAAVVAEIVGNVIRVPAEVVKQRAQAIQGQSSYSSLLFTLKSEGFKGLYRGFGQTVARDVPYSTFQFVSWEKIKHEWSSYKQRPVTAIESGIAGAFGAALASFLTTPLDVAKTRVMLAESHSALLKSSLLGVIFDIGIQDGLVSLFKGATIRVTVYSTGGIVFFTVYEKAYIELCKLKERTS